MSTLSYKEIIERCHVNKSETYKIYYFHRLLSLPLTKLFYKYNVKPDTISISMIFLSILSFFMMSTPSNVLFNSGMLIAFLAFLFDKVDGDLARLYEVDNIKGAVYDFVYHRLSLFLFYLAIGIHFSSFGTEFFILAALSGFLANYIEEMQLLSFRIFSHKYLKYGENMIIDQNEGSLKFGFLKILKIFRMQLFLFYFFALGSFLNFYIENIMYYFILSSFISLLIFSFYQVFLVMTSSFNKDINQLLSIVKKGGF